MKKSDLKQISELRKLRADESESQLARERALLREAEEHHQATIMQERRAIQHEREATEAAWKQQNKDQSTQDLQAFYHGIVERKNYIMKCRDEVAEAAKAEEKQHETVVEARGAYFKAKRAQDRWEQFRKRLDEEEFRREERKSEEADEELRLRQNKKKVSIRSSSLEGAA